MGEKREKNTSGAAFSFTALSETGSIKSKSSTGLVVVRIDCGWS